MVSKSDHGRKLNIHICQTSYVYLLKAAYFGRGGGIMYLPVLFIIGWATDPPDPRIDGPACTILIMSAKLEGWCSKKHQNDHMEMKIYYLQQSSS